MLFRSLRDLMAPMAGMEEVEVAEVPVEGVNVNRCVLPTDLVDMVAEEAPVEGAEKQAHTETVEADPSLYSSLMEQRR